MKIDWLSFTKKYKRPEPHQFPTGSRVYTGHQGSGKTLSCTKYLYDLKKAYPKCKIFSNVKLYGIKYYPITDIQSLKVALLQKNGSNGTAILLDEAHLYFGRKDGIPLEVLTCISQQRKDRRRLIFTSQIWEELDISLRKQVKEIVKCRCFLGFIQINTVSDGETLHYDKLNSEYVADKKYTEIFKHNIEYYRRYDTYQKIVTNEEYQTPPTLKPVIYQALPDGKKK